MTSKRLLLGVLAAWLVAFAGSFDAFYVTPSRDFGLTAGINRTGAWSGCQADGSRDAGRKAIGGAWPALNWKPTT